MSDAAANTADLFEIIQTTRSMRRLKPDPVPNELIRKILEAGVCAPSGGNMQRWRFLVVRDPKVKETVGACYKRAWDEQVAPRYRTGTGHQPGAVREEPRAASRPLNRFVRCSSLLASCA
jgi:nitroreductase